MNKFTPILIAGCLVSGAAAAVDHSLSATYKEQTADRLMANRTMADADTDGMISRDECNKHADRISTQVLTETDTNGDDMLSEDEMMNSTSEEWFIRFNQ